MQRLGRCTRVAVVVGVAALAMTLVSACGAGNSQPAAPGISQSSSSVASLPSPSSAPSVSSSSAPASSSAPVTVAAVGDIVCNAQEQEQSRTDPAHQGECGSDAVLAVVKKAKPSVVLLLGDVQYETGAVQEYAQSFTPTWGVLKKNSYPVVGNHEYKTPGARGYFDFWGAQTGTAGQGWYSFTLGAWHVVALNSNCDQVDCGPDSAQVRWLKADLAQHPSRCTLGIWHHPVWNDGRHGPTPAMRPALQALYDAGADLVLNGHDHNYQRFAPRAPEGSVDSERGVRQIVNGAGGRSHYSLTKRSAQVANGDTYGALILTLRADGYSWAFTPAAGGTFKDAGSASCH